MASQPASSGGSTDAAVNGAPDGRQLAAILDASADAVVCARLDGTITYANAAARLQFALDGHGRAEAVDLFCAIAPDESDELRRAVARVAAAARPATVVVARTGPDGSVSTAQVALLPLRDDRADGLGVVGVCATVRDVSERVRAEDDARESQARGAAILASALDPIITIDGDGRILEFNPAAERTFGHRRDTVLGRTLSDVIVPARYRGAHQAGLARTVETGDATILDQRLELSALRADGTEIPVELTVTRVPSAGPPVFTGYLRDITEQRRIRDDLIESERRLQELLDNLPAVVHLKSASGRYLVVNRQYEQVVGVDRADVTGRSDAELFPSEVADRYRERDALVLESRLPLEVEEVIDAPDGPRTFHTVKFPLIGASGVVYALAGISTDITERQRAESERLALEDRLHRAQRLESLGQLAGGVAHDFNNLLAVILTSAEFISDAVAADPDVSADVEEIRKAAERAASLTRQLLIFGRRETVQTEALDVNGAVHEVRRLLSRTIGEHVALVVELAPGALVVRADRGQLEQVLVNLAVNARDAMPAGGTLTIETATVELDEVYARTNPAVRPGRYVQLAVSDTGMGMTDDVVARAFEPFFTTKPAGSGTGLGLATVYGIVAQSGGSVSIYSEPGIGTTVRVYLPAVAEDAPAPPAPPADRGRPRDETLLVVEDEEPMRRVTCRLLRRNGFTVLEAGTAAEAMALAEAHVVDLVLTDVVMPEVSGPDLAERLRARRPDLPVLFMSGYSLGVLGPQQALDPDIALIQKPFNERSLLASIEAVLTRG